jgi:lipid II:glycine glycyltransferase (peptidoglycan interpeptide bridge formation enzyme)
LAGSGALIAASCGAQILFRLCRAVLLWGISQGPVGNKRAELLPEIDAVCREHKGSFLRSSQIIGKAKKHSLSLRARLEAFSPHQPRRTIFVPIEGTEEQILSSMKQKTRYNVHLAEKKGIQVHLSTDIAAFQRMMLITGKRDGIGVHAQSYYQKAFDLFHSSGRCDLLFAEYEAGLWAGIMGLCSGKTAWYMYGASTDEERTSHADLFAPVGIYPLGTAKRLHGL